MRLDTRSMGMSVRVNEKLHGFSWKDVIIGQRAQLSSSKAHAYTYAYISIYIIYIFISEISNTFCVSSHIEKNLCLSCWQVEFNLFVTQFRLLAFRYNEWQGSENISVSQRKEPKFVVLKVYFFLKYLQWRDAKPHLSQLLLYSLQPKLLKSFSTNKKM